jgi:hypothetical protein
LLAALGLINNNYAQFSMFLRKKKYATVKKDRTIAIGSEPWRSGELLSSGMLRLSPG